jgi:hypothetical protein
MERIRAWDTWNRVESRAEQLIVEQSRVEQLRIE